MKTGILKSLVLILGMLLMGSFLVNPAIAKEYPTKTIEILCPYPAGSAVDIMIISCSPCMSGTSTTGT